MTGAHGDRPNGKRGLTIPRVSSSDDAPPCDLVTWDRRVARITNDRGEVLFEQGGVEIPKEWSQTATNVVVSRYFAGQLGTPERERSVRELLRRVIGTIARWGEEDGYFAKRRDARVFRDELQHIVLNQMASFNSPVWFNLGLSSKPATSACYINGIDDDMDSIMALARVEAKLFESGAGSGINLSCLRAKNEPLSGGGSASGPVSFMRGFDAFSSVIKSRDDTRPPARIVILDVDHPDIEEFINCKVQEQRKAWSLIRAGYDGSEKGEAWSSVAFQHTHLAARVDDEFMAAVEENRPWKTLSRLDKSTASTTGALTLFNELARAVHESGEPGIQFASVINDWHTCPESGSINASTPCSEFMFLDDSACNLASLNLMAFLDEQGVFDVDVFRHVVDCLIIAMDILVDRSSYPKAEIAKNSRAYRPLGLGYTNLGAFLMAQGHPYDSRKGRALAATVAGLMTGEAYAQSGRLAEVFGPFGQYSRNRAPLRRVIGKHVEALRALHTEGVPENLREAARQSWQEAQLRVETRGVRNAQVTAIAPTGTISLMMDCETTGIEPDFALVKERQVARDEALMVVNKTLPLALRALGYNRSQRRQIVEHIEEQGTIESAPGLRSEHLPVFDCAQRAQTGRRAIIPEGHIRMMGAIQPFISGAISKTITLSSTATAEDIAAVFIEAHRRGLKAISVYRDGSRRPPEREEDDDFDESASSVGPRRHKLPDERRSVTHKFSIAGHDGYLTVGMYEDGSPGELFIRMAKAGSVVAGLVDSIALSISLALQYGVPLQVLVERYAHSRFEPSGFTTNPEIPIAKSIMDYIFRWLGMRFLTDDDNLSTESNDDDLPSLLPGE